MAALIEQLIKPSDYLLILIRHNQMLVIDPSAAAPLCKYMLSSAASCPPIFIQKYQQLLIPQAQNNYIAVYNTDNQKVVSKIPTIQKIKYLILSNCQSILFAISVNDRLSVWQVFSGAKLQDYQSPVSNVSAIYFQNQQNSIILIGQALVARITLSQLLYGSKSSKTVTLGRPIICSCLNNFTLSLGLSGQNVAIMHSKTFQIKHNISLQSKAISMMSLNGRLIILQKLRLIQLIKQFQTYKQIRLLDLKQPGQFIIPFQQSNQIILGSKSSVLRIGQKIVKLQSRADSAIFIKRFQKPRNAECIPILDKYKRQKQNVLVTAKKTLYQPDLNEIMNFVINHQKSRQDDGVRARMLEQQNRKLQQVCDQAFQQLQKYKGAFQSHNYRKQL